MIITPGEIKNITFGTIIQPVSYYINSVGYLSQLHRLYDFKEIYRHPNNFFTKFGIRPGVDFIGLQVYKKDGTVNEQKLALAVRKLKKEPISKIPGVFCYFKTDEQKALLKDFDDSFILLEFPTEDYINYHSGQKLNVRKLDVVKNANLPFLHCCN